MDNMTLIGKYLPMTESAYCILLSLRVARHGYGIMQYVEETTKGRIKIGPGTMYGTLSKLENEQLIIQDREEDRKKIYKLSDKGRAVLELEIERLQELVDMGRREIGGAL